MSFSKSLACALACVVLTAAPAVAAEKKAAVKKAPPGRSETLACRLGTEDRHARIAVVVVKGKMDSFAYYSKWKPRTCSIYLQRNRDMYSKWADNGGLTTVDIEKGAFIVENRKNEYHFIFRNVDRERYCGMDGVINGTLTIKKGNEQCILGGDIMVEGTPLGEANVVRTGGETPPPAAGASDVAPAAPAQQAAPIATEAAAPADPTIPVAARGE